LIAVDVAAPVLTRLVVVPWPHPVSSIAAVARLIVEISICLRCSMVRPLTSRWELRVPTQPGGNLVRDVKPRPHRRCDLRHRWKKYG